MFLRELWEQKLHNIPSAEFNAKLHFPRNEIRAAETMVLTASSAPTFAKREREREIETERDRVIRFIL